MRPRTQMLALMLIACGPATWAADLAADQVPLRTAQLRTDALPLERQVADLQKQVLALQSQVHALLSAVQVTAAGVVVQGPVVTIKGDTIEVKSDRNLALIGGNLVAVTSSGGATLQATGNVDVKGSAIRLNNGGRAVATTASQVHTPPGSSNGQIITGSQTVFAD